MGLDNPVSGEYDFSLGAQEPEILSYIKESMVVQSRISPIKAYLLQPIGSGSVSGTINSPFTITSYIETTPQYRSIIWASGSNHPDIRPYTNQGKGSITVIINSTEATRVIDVEDIINDNEFAVVKRMDLLSARVELVFNEGFNATGATIQYYYTTLESGVNVERMKSGEGTFDSLFGWNQYLDTTSDMFRGVNQILIRYPLSQEDLIVNEEGRVKLEQADCWTIWEPRLFNYDILVVTGDQTFSGEEERYEVTDKRDSRIQGTLITQRFKLRYIESSDPRYSIAVATI
ncbi:MAG: hypothetical protein M0R17_02360 [Candidatus Omnitrophica bacterium]|jgi:hypothetical protein|nr:hypothetical protein [Candidatus Omnitrophota bacterium]